jgi:hypothetical protein
VWTASSLHTQRCTDAATETSDWSVVLGTVEKGDLLTSDGVPPLESRVALGVV